MPSFVVIGAGKEHDNTQARRASAGLKSGEILVMDRAYVDLEHFEEMEERGVIWVTRMKEGMVYTTIEKKEVKAGGKVHSDEVIVLSNGTRARRIVAEVEVDGKKREMTFLTNQVEWSAETLVALYEARWEIEVFFKQLKQTLKLCDLVSYNANGIRWQVWTALMVHVIMRYVAWRSGWVHSFSRLYALVRSILWEKRDLWSVLDRYGTAKGSYRNTAQPSQAYLPGLA